MIRRLWRRAPAWRFCLITAVALTALTAMFPPAIPHLPSFLQKHPEAGKAADLAHYSAPSHEAPTLPADSGMIHMPPLDAGRQGIVPVSGRLLPLPAGTWHELALARLGGPEPTQVTVLDRIDGNHLVGLIVSVAPTPQVASAGPVRIPPSCIDPARIAGHITTAEPGDSPLTHQCWSLLPIDMKQAVSDKSGNELLQRGMARLGERNISVPDQMLMLSYFSSDDNGWLMTSVYLPDHPGYMPGALHRIQDWAQRFSVPIQKGFTRTLTEADLTPAIIRDPT